MKKWKLVYREDALKICNIDGKELGYQPNSGIGIIDVDGYAFKDLDRDGVLAPFEDWRLPMEERVADFSKRYHLIQKGNLLFYEKGTLTLPEDMIRDITDIKHLQDQIISHDTLYLKEHSMLVVLLLMFDYDSDQSRSDYIIQLFVQSLHMGMLENVFYSIRTAILKYLHEQEVCEQLQFDMQ